jgi:hypothetical protein
VNKNLVLPDSEQAQPLSERGPIIVVMRGEVLLDGEVIASVDEADEQPGIPALTERLTQIREQGDRLEGELRRLDPTREVKAFDGHLIVQADEDTDFKLVRRAVYSANEAGWVHLQFAVRRMVQEGAPHEG